MPGSRTLREQTNAGAYDKPYGGTGWDDYDTTPPATPPQQQQRMTSRASELDARNAAGSPRTASSRAARGRRQDEADAMRDTARDLTDRGGSQ